MQISCCIQEHGFKVFTGHIIIGNVMKKAKHFSWHFFLYPFCIFMYTVYDR